METRPTKNDRPDFYKILCMRSTQIFVDNNTKPYTAENVKNISKRFTTLILNKNLLVEVVQAIPAHIQLVVFKDSMPPALLKVLPQHVTLILHTGTPIEEIASIPPYIKNIILFQVNANLVRALNDLQLKARLDVIELQPEVVKLLSSSTPILKVPTNTAPESISAIPSCFTFITFYTLNNSYYQLLTAEHVKNIPLHIKKVYFKTVIDEEIARQIPKHVTHIFCLHEWPRPVGIIITSVPGRHLDFLPSENESDIDNHVHQASKRLALEDFPPHKQSALKRQNTGQQVRSSTNLTNHLLTLQNQPISGQQEIKQLKQQLEQFKGEQSALMRQLSVEQEQIKQLEVKIQQLDEHSIEIKQLIQLQNEVAVKINTFRALNQSRWLPQEAEQHAALPLATHTSAMLMPTSRPGMQQPVIPTARPVTQAPILPMTRSNAQVPQVPTVSSVGGRSAFMLTKELAFAPQSASLFSSLVENKVIKKESEELEEEGKVLTSPQLNPK